MLAWNWGQLMFILVMLVLIRALHKIRYNWPQWVYQLQAYGIRSMAAFWFVERGTDFLCIKDAILVGRQSNIRKQVIMSVNQT